MSEDLIRILIVEDELIIARSLEKLIERLGHRVSCIVSSGDAALDEIAESPPDLILMDICIKGEKDGIETAMQIHEDYDIPIVYLTAYADDQTLERAAHSGSYGYIVKPARDRELHATIKVALQKHQQYQALKNSSIRDPLTKLLNRRFLDEALKKEQHIAERSNSVFTLVMVDIDFFKKFNDTYGHAAGDFVIQEIANLLMSQVRKSDFVCRYGGEEMTLLLRNCSTSHALAIAETIRYMAEHLDLTYEAQDLGHVTLSLGIATFPEHGVTGEAVMKAADEALYMAKQNGRNQCQIYTAPVDEPQPSDRVWDT